MITATLLTGGGGSDGNGYFTHGGSDGNGYTTHGGSDGNGYTTHGGSDGGCLVLGCYRTARHSIMHGVEPSHMTLAITLWRGAMVAFTSLH